MMLLLKFLPAWLVLLEIVSAIWPLPVHYSHGSKVLWLSPDFQTVYTPLSSMQRWDTFYKYLLYVADTPLERSALLIADTGLGGILILMLCITSRL